MSNVLSEEKKQQVIALGKLGWPLRRIEQATGVRRETAGAYLKAAGIGVRPSGAHVGTYKSRAARNQIFHSRPFPPTEQIEGLRQLQFRSKRIRGLPLAIRQQGTGALS